MIFLLSPDTEFSGNGIGKKSSINYKNLFFNYKKVLVTKWKSKRIEQLVTKLDNYIFGTAQPSTFSSAQEDHTDAINRAMVALDVDSDESDASGFAADAVDIVSAAQSSISVASALSSINDASATVTVDVAHIEADSVVQDVQDAGGSQLEGKGRGKGRKKRAPVPSGTVARTTRSHKV